MKIFKTLVLYLDDLAYLTGAGLVSYGASQIYAPAGWIVGGVFLVGYGFLIGLGRDKE